MGHVSIDSLHQLRDVLATTLESARVEWEHEVMKVQEKGKADLPSLKKLDQTRIDYMLMAAKLSGVDLVIRAVEEMEVA